MVLGCGKIVMLKHPENGNVVKCDPPPGKYWNPGAATEACARGYEAGGYQRVSEY
jgi:hypothetical protein